MATTHLNNPEALGDPVQIATPCVSAIESGPDFRRSAITVGEYGELNHLNFELNARRLVGSGFIVVGSEAIVLPNDEGNHVQAYEMEHIVSPVFDGELLGASVVKHNGEELTFFAVCFVFRSVRRISDNFGDLPDVLPTSKHLFTPIRGIQRMIPSRI